MALRPINSLETTGKICLDAALFTGVGYLCGRTVNHIQSWNLKDKIFNKSKDYVDLNTFAKCCVLFIVIDQILKSSFKNLFHGRANEFHFFVPRISLSLVSTIGLINTGANIFKYTALDKQAALFTLLITIVAYSYVFKSLENFNNRIS
jgi:hypothetical protein